MYLLPSPDQSRWDFVFLRHNRARQQAQVFVRLLSLVLWFDTPQQLSADKAQESGVYGAVE